MLFNAPQAHYALRVRLHWVYLGLLAAVFRVVLVIGVVVVVVALIVGIVVVVGVIHSVALVIGVVRVVVCIDKSA